MARGDEFVKEELTGFEVEYQGETYKFKKRELSWRQQNKVVSKCFKISDQGLSFDLDLYCTEILRKILVEHPWDNLEIALTRLNEEFGNVLMNHVPKPPFMESAEEASFFDQGSKE